MGPALWLLMRGKPTAAPSVSGIRAHDSAESSDSELETDQLDQLSAQLVNELDGDNVGYW